MAGTSKAMGQVNGHGDVRVHLARWLVPVSAPAVEDGAIAAASGRIIAAGSRKDVIEAAGLHARIVDHGDAVIMPGLVNCHCHLELSHARGLMPVGKGFAVWLRHLMDFIADSSGPGIPDAETAARDALDELTSGGTACLGDVGNSGLGNKVLMSSVSVHGLLYVSFREVIHPFSDNISLNDLPSREGGAGQQAWSAHSAYTCSMQALRAIKNRCSSASMPFSVHCAESQEEMEFIRSAGGPLAAILRERGRDIQGFFRTARTPVELLDRAGVLDASTICVHCTHVDSMDIELLQRRKSHVCLCPGSNAFIGTGTAPFEEIFYELPSRVCLGTDSLASSDSLSIFEQMKMILDKAPAVRPEDVLRAATVNGARAMGLSGHAGSIEEGKMANFLVLQGVSVPGHELLEYICCMEPPFSLKVIRS